MHLAYSDGRSGALEVTSHAGEGVRQMEGLLGRDGWTWPKPWSVVLDHFGSGTFEDLRRLGDVYEHVIQQCESLGAVTPETLPAGLRRVDPHVRWVVESSARWRVTHPCRPRGMTGRGAA